MPSEVCSAPVHGCAVVRCRTRATRGQTLAEVLIALAILTIIAVFITGDLTNMTRVDRATDRTVEVSAANYLINVMQTDPGFWTGVDNGHDWSSGPAGTCFAGLAPYTDPGPSPSPGDTPNWHDMPTSAPADCPPAFTDQGAPQSYSANGLSGSPAPVGNTVQYMWNVTNHVPSGDVNPDPNAADLTVWVRRDASAPVFTFHAIRYEYPAPVSPSPLGAGSPSPNGTTPPPHTPNPGASKPAPTPTPTGFGV